MHWKEKKGFPHYDCLVHPNARQPRYAQHSTGPRTAEGKLASSQNSVTSGLIAAAIFIRPDEKSAFGTFKADLNAELKPEGKTQRHHFSLILHAAWNIRRCLQLEAEIQYQASTEGVTDALLDDDLARKLDRIYRYKKMHESTHRRSSGDLRQLQTEQLFRLQNPDVPGASILVDIARMKPSLRQRNSSQQRTNLDVVHQQAVDFIAPPQLLNHNGL